MESKTLRRTQDKLLEMGIIIAHILEKNSIKYMLGFGTLLGAVRHEGFIPWDDDFDLQIFWDDYDRAIEALKTELPENLFLEDETTEPKYFHAWAHVKDRNSEAYCNEFPQDQLYEHKGISVDLYRIKMMPFSELQFYINSENEKYINRRLEKGLIDEEDYVKRKQRLSEDVKIAELNPIKDNKMVFGFTTSHKRKYLDVDDVLPLKPIEFANHLFMGPAKPINAVSAIYGDYMKLPPEEKRREHYSKVVFFDDKD